MVAPAEELRAQLANWFAGVDPTMQGILSTIYAEAPAAVSKAISNGAWEADESDPPLTDLLGGGDAFARSGMVASNMTTEPWPLTVGATGRIGWTVSAGPTGHPAFTTTVTLTAPDGGSSVITLETAALGPGAETPLSFELPDVVEGTYTFTIDMNPDGAPDGMPPNEAGTHIVWQGIEVPVMSADAGANQQDDTAYSAATGRLMLLVNIDTQSARYSLADLSEAFNWLAAVEGLEAADAQAISEASDRLGRVQERLEDTPEPFVQACIALGVAASRNSNRHQSAELFDALRAWNEAITAAY